MTFEQNRFLVMGLGAIAVILFAFFFVSAVLAVWHRKKKR